MIIFKIFLLFYFFFEQVFIHLFSLSTFFSSHRYPSPIVAFSIVAATNYKLQNFLLLMIVLCLSSFRLNLKLCCCIASWPIDRENFLCFSVFKRTEDYCQRKKKIKKFRSICLLQIHKENIHFHGLLFQHLFYSQFCLQV